MSALENIPFRVVSDYSPAGDQPKAIAELSMKLDKIEELMKKWKTTMEHITEEERAEVLEKVGEVRKWIEEKVDEQEKADATLDLVFTSEEVPGQTKRIESIVARLMKKPKPKPVEKKNETDSSTEKNETQLFDDASSEASSEKAETDDGEAEPDEADEAKDSEKADSDEL
jgi:hypoxia up-regulated 1